jgi:hypothetical protein
VRSDAPLEGTGRLMQRPAQPPQSAPAQ